MRHHRARFLHILAIAPVAAIAAGVLGPAPHALAASGQPAPIVVTVDPGFGGEPTPAHPTIRFDPGAIGVNGILEKDVDLDVGTRLAALLRADLVDVVMTRTTDVYVSQTRRQQLSRAHHAALVVSVEAGSSSYSKATGCEVTYATAGGRNFAQTLSDALQVQLSPDGVPDDGVALDAKSWSGSAVPTATVKMAYLSNPGDAALIATPAFRQSVAAGVRDGIEAYMPAIIARRSAIIAWRDAHPGSVSPSLAPTSAAIPQGKGFQFGPVIAWLAGIAIVGLILLFRDAVARVLVVLIALIGHLVGLVLRMRRAFVRRRRRRRRERTFDMDAPARAQRSRKAGSMYDVPVYDDVAGSNGVAGYDVPAYDAVAGYGNLPAYGNVPADGNVPVYDAVPVAELQGRRRPVVYGEESGVEQQGGAGASVQDEKQDRVQRGRRRPSVQDEAQAPVQRGRRRPSVQDESSLSAQRGRSRASVYDDIPM
jgi:N-acetylmuramoyl-L-alanine amidase